jgi:membrane-associated phospholipid phosphatase
MKAINVYLKYYVLGFVCFEIACLTYVFSFTRFEQVRLINSFHSPFADYAFQFLSFLAEIYMTLLVLFYLIWKKRHYIKPYVLSYLLSTILTQGLKHFVFSDQLRPFAYFKSLNYSWHLVDGVFLNEYNSFPSGHTAAAWFLFFWLTLLINKKYGLILCVCLAIGVAYSRVYLFQHFPVDTALGAFIGLFSAYFVYHYLPSTKNLQ